MSTIDTFIQSQTPQLRGHVDRYLAQRITSKELRRYLNGALKDWQAIPTETRNEPYAPTEESFWLVFNLARAATLPKLDGVRRKIASKDLVEIVKYLGLGSLPDSYQGKRPL